MPLAILAEVYAPVLLRCFYNDVDILLLLSGGASGTPPPPCTHERVAGQIVAFIQQKLRCLDMKYRIE